MLQSLASVTCCSASRVPATLHSSHGCHMASAYHLTWPSFSFYCGCEQVTNLLTLWSPKEDPIIKHSVPGSLRSCEPVWRLTVSGPTPNPEKSLKARVTRPCGQLSFGGSPDKAERHSKRFLPKLPFLPVFFLSSLCQCLWLICSLLSLFLFSFLPSSFLSMTTSVYMRIWSFTNLYLYSLPTLWQ